MDIQILDSWLREYIDTNATPTDIARCLSLCGPSIERTEKVTIDGKSDTLYHIEVTTNRVDMMSVMGIAREASVILPEFGFKVKLTKLEVDNGETKLTNAVKIDFKTNPKLIYRVMGVILEIPQITSSQKYIEDRLTATGIRALNSIVDVTNYVMTEIGHPTHVFDYDLIAPYMEISESKKGEEVTSFDGKTHKLPGGDIVIRNKKGEIIDLPGIIGTKNSVVNNDTKRILFFIDVNDPVKIRKTSMTLGIRTVAATLNEKGVDPELAEIALKRGLHLYKKLTNAKQISEVFDLYQKKDKPSKITVKHSFIERVLGVSIDTKRVLKILRSLKIETDYNESTKSYTCIPPSFRHKDLVIPDDIAEEVARIYGYFNLPSKVMDGNIPENDSNAHFDFEKTIKEILKGLGANEVYTYSLVKDESGSTNLKIKNPLGSDFSELRTSLFYSLIDAGNENRGETEPFHIFEMANVYIPQKGKLPNEELTLSGLFKGYTYREAKGVIEALLNSLKIKADFRPTEVMKSTVKILNSAFITPVNGSISETKDFIYYEFTVENLFKNHSSVQKYVPIPVFPPQIEDMTVKLKKGQLVGDIMTKIKSASHLVVKVDLTDIYNDNYTFRIWYQDLEKNLTDKDVEIIRKQVELAVKN